MNIVTIKKNSVVDIHDGETISITVEEGATVNIYGNIERVVALKGSHVNIKYGVVKNLHIHDGADVQCNGFLHHYMNSVFYVKKTA